MALLMQIKEEVPGWRKVEWRRSVGRMNPRREMAGTGGDYENRNADPMSPRWSKAGEGVEFQCHSPVMFCFSLVS